MADVASLSPGNGWGALPSPISLLLGALTISPAIVNTITVTEQTFTLPGIPAAAFVGVTEDGAPTGNVSPVPARRSAANTVAIRWVNPTAGNLTPAVTTTYRFLIATATPS